MKTISLNSSEPVEVIIYDHGKLVSHYIAKKNVNGILVKVRELMKGEKK